MQPHLKLTLKPGNSLLIATSVKTEPVNIIQQLANALSGCHAVLGDGRVAIGDGGCDAL